MQTGIGVRRWLLLMVCGLLACRSRGGPVDLTDLDATQTQLLNEHVYKGCPGTQNVYIRGNSGKPSEQ